MKLEELKVVLRALFGMFMLALSAVSFGLSLLFIKNHTLQAIAILVFLIYLYSMLWLTYLIGNLKCGRLTSKIAKFIFGADILFDDDSL
jgi:hypothetical protein